MSFFRSEVKMEMRDVNPLNRVYGDPYRKMCSITYPSTISVIADGVMMVIVGGPPLLLMAAILAGMAASIAGVDIFAIGGSK